MGDANVVVAEQKDPSRNLQSVTKSRAIVARAFLSTVKYIYPLTTGPGAPGKGFPRKPWHLIVAEKLMFRIRPDLCA